VRSNHRQGITWTEHFLSQSWQTNFSCFTEGKQTNNTTYECSKTVVTTAENFYAILMLWCSVYILDVYGSNPWPCQPFFNSISIRHPQSDRVIAICSAHRLLWQDSDKHFDHTQTLPKSIMHWIIIIINSIKFRVSNIFDSQNL